MKKAAITTIFAAVAMFFAFSASAAQYQDVAILSYSEGDVQLKLNDETDWGPVEPDIALQKDDQIKTGPNGKARIVLEDESVIVIGELSLFRISAVEYDSATERKNAEFHLENGLARAKVTKLKTDDSAFTITTPTAVAGVRGTEFAVEALRDKKLTTVTVFEGAVEVGDRINKFKNAVKVMKEQATDVKPGGPEKPRKVDVQRIKRLRQKLSNAKLESGGQGVSAEDKKAATIVAIKRSGIDGEKVGELVRDVKNGDLPAEQVKTVISMKDHGASDSDVNKTLDVIKKKNVDTKTVRELSESIKNRDDGSSITNKIEEFRKKTDNLEDRPEPASGAAPADRKPSTTGPDNRRKPEVMTPELQEKARKNVEEAKNAIENRKDRDQEGQNTAGSNTAGVNSKEKMLIEQAKNANIPKDKLDQLIKAYKDGKLDFADASMIVNAAANGVEIRFLENVLAQLNQARVNIETRRLLLNAIRVGMSPEQVQRVFERIKAVQNTDNMSLADLNKQLQDYIKSRIENNTGSTGSPPGVTPPPPGVNTPPNSGDNGTTSGGNTGAPRRLPR